MRFPRPGSIGWGDALIAGAVLGLLAQFIRQINGPLLELGASTAPWVTLGFVVAILATRGGGTAAGIQAMAAYLYAWLAAYHLLFAVRESVGLAAAWSEAAPWLVLAAPASVLLGAAAARTHRPGRLGDACLALPIAWSLPEVIQYTSEGWPNSVAVAGPMLALSVLPLIVAGRHDVHVLRVAVASLALGVAAVTLSPIVLSQIHS